MIILGDVSEAVIVHRCNEDSVEINSRWISLAKRKPQNGTTYYFTAVGTGFKSTKLNNPYRYNKNDTQKDIIWVDEENTPILALFRPNESGIQAALQVKTTSDGKKYVLPDLIRWRYEHPIAYISMKDDYYEVLEEANKKLAESGEKEFVDGETNY